MPGRGMGGCGRWSPTTGRIPGTSCSMRRCPMSFRGWRGSSARSPQTPLSHVDLRATQHGIPNAFIRDAQNDAEISALIGQYVYYQVAEKSFEIRAATKAEVDAHYESLRPTSTQTPERDLRRGGDHPAERDRVQRQRRVWREGGQCRGAREAGLAGGNGP